MPDSAQKLKKNSGLTDTAYVLTFATVARFAKRLLEMGGIYTLALLIPVELGKAAAYWMKSNDPAFKDSPTKKWLNRTYYSSKAAAVTAGIVLALMGSVLLGFTVIIATGYLASLRSLGKTIRSVIDGDVRKAGNNLGKTIIGGMISVGFTLTAFFPPLAMVGWGLIMIGTGYSLLSTFFTAAPKMLVNQFGPVKAPEWVLKKGDDQVVSLPRFTPGFDGKFTHEVAKNADLSSGQKNKY